MHKVAALACALYIASAASVAAGIYLVAGPGWALIASGVFGLLAAAILMRGLSNNG